MRGSGRGHTGGAGRRSTSPRSPSRRSPSPRSPGRTSPGRIALAVAAVVAGALLFAANATASKLALEAGLAASNLVQLRTGGAAVVLLAFVAVTRPRSLRLTWRDALGLALYGVVGIAVVQFLYSVAIARLPVGIALLLEYTAPLMVAGWVFVVWRQPLRPRIWLALIACLGGLALVAQIGGDTQLSLTGVAAALGAAACLAAYFVLGARHVANRDVYSTLAWSMTFAAVFWLIAAPVWTLPFDLLGSGVAVPYLGTVPLWLLVADIVVLGTALPYLAELWALGPLGPARASLIAMLEPVAAAAIAWAMLGEAMTSWQIVGGVVVLAGIALAETARRGGARALG